MKIYAFYGVSKNKFIGYTKNEERSKKILENRPDDFVMMKVNIKDDNGLWNHKFHKIKIGSRELYMTGEECHLFLEFSDYICTQMMYMLLEVEERWKKVKVADHEYNVLQGTVELLRSRVLMFVDLHLECLSDDYGLDLTLNQEYIDVDNLLKQYLNYKRQDETMEEFLNALVH